MVLELDSSIQVSRLNLFKKGISSSFSSCVGFLRLFFVIFLLFSKKYLQFIVFNCIKCVNFTYKVKK